MKSVTFLQLGDVHYPAYRDDRTVDQQDPGLSPRLLDATTGSRLKATLRSVARRLLEGSPIVLISGDLTEKGSLDGYRECVGYLIEALDLTRLAADPSRLFVVPGNHDIFRPDVPNHDGLEEKFAPLRQVWEDAGLLGQFDVRARQVPVTVAGGRVHVAALNSCIGCGELRYLPDAIAGQIQAARQALEDKGSDPTVDASEQLDTPAFLMDDIDDLVGELTAPTPPGAAIVLAHHNLLPQAIPRVAIYTELLNSGMVRSQLTGIPVPVIYAHGHIHSDPIEVVEQYAPGEGMLVSVGAPLLVDGYNEIDVAFSDDGRALGCEITFMRLGHDGLVRSATPRRIAFRASLGRSAAHDAVRRVLRIGETMRAPEVLTEVEEEGPFTEDQVKEVLEELAWSGHLELVGLEEEMDRWIIRTV